MSSSASAPRRTKIVATLGPACASRDSIEKLLRAGVNVVRVNASHGDHATHAVAIGHVRSLAAAMQRPVGILLDLQGPKIRVGRFEGPAKEVAAGEEFSFAVGRPPQAGELPADYPYLDRDVTVGQPLLINDGNLASEVVHVEPGLVRCRAQHAGSIEQRKGINLPQSHVSAPAVSDKDRADALFAVEQKVDMIALSFVRRAADVLELQAILQSVGADTPIISKIEKPQALHNLQEIVRVSWGVMVARGDLGVELSTADVPMAQKRIIREANKQCKPVITATQMLDSMTRNPQPTRAEASDVANAVLDGTDAVMLSQETAAGLYPVKTVETMVQIIHAVERDQDPRPRLRPRDLQQSDIPEAVAFAGCEVAQLLQAKAMVVLTDTGRMALLASQRRLEVPIMAFARDEAVRNSLCLACNVTPYLASPSVSLEERVRHLDKFLLENGSVAQGDKLVLLVGRPNAPTGSTNLMMVHRVGSRELA
jgi:pyruvate kinase